MQVRLGQATRPPASNMAERSCAHLQMENMKEFLASVDNFIFDCDGVLWSGQHAFPGVIEVLQGIRKLGKKVIFVTNNSSRSRKQYLEKFSRFGIEASKEEVFSSSSAAAFYLKNVLKLDKKVYTMGGKGITEELEEMNLAHTGLGEDGFDESKGLDTYESLELDPEVGAVVCGFDKHFSHHKLVKAVTYLSKDTCAFVGTNMDMRFPVRNMNVVVPGTGCLISCVETAARRRAVIVGKPEKTLFDCVMSQHGIDPSKSCMVGDNLDTDIIFGNRFGMKTLFVLTGISSLLDVESSLSSDDKSRVPDLYVNALSDFLPVIKDIIH